MAGSGTDYDEVEYPGFAFPQTRPDRLSSVARLLGLRSERVDGSRVLELGCGDGTNLLAMAIIRPGSDFVGIDTSSRAIATAHALSSASGISNTEFHQVAVEDLQPELGRFDYIVAHGLYSWVAPSARDALLARCRELLAPNGVAYVSYNAYPGSFLHDMAHEILEYQSRESVTRENRYAGRGGWPT